jgi:hypothetical protein
MSISRWCATGSSSSPRWRWPTDPEDRKEVLANLRRAEDLQDLAEKLGLPDRMGFFD